jgi:O-antigen/teichoic acid export membrane protein
MTNLTRLFNGTVTYGFGSMLTQLIGFLLLPIFTAYLSPADYGVIAILGVIGFAAAPIFGLGIGAALGIVYFSEDSPTHKREAVSTAVCLVAISASLLAALGCIYSHQLSQFAFNSPEYAWYVSVYLLGTACGMITLILLLHLQLEERARLYVVLTVLVSLVTVCFNVVLVILLEYGVAGWVIGSAAGQAVTCVVLLVTLLSTTRFRLRMGLARQLLKIGVPLVPSFILLYVMAHSAKYTLQWMRSLEEVGIYDIGCRFGMVLALLVGAFTTAWYPYFQSFVNKRDEARELFGCILTYYVAGFGSLCLLFFVFARPVVQLMTQPEFHAAYQVIGFVAVSQLFIGVFSIFTTGVYYAKRVYLVSVIQFVCAVIVVLANFILIPRYGIVGAAIAIAGGYVLLGVLQQAANLLLKLWTPTYEWMRIVKLVLLFTIVAAGSTLLGNILSPVAYMLLSPVIALILLFLVWQQLSAPEKACIRERLRSAIGR